MLLARQLPVRDKVAVMGTLLIARSRSTLYWRRLTLVVVCRKAPPRFKGKPGGDNELSEDADDDDVDEPDEFGERLDEPEEVGDDEGEEQGDADDGSPFELCFRASAFLCVAAAAAATAELASCSLVCRCC